MLFASASLFLTSILSKHLLTDDAFFHWGVMLTFISIAVPIVFLGSESLILRTVLIKNNTIIVSRSVVKILVFSLIFCVLFFSNAFNFFFDTFQTLYYSYILALIAVNVLIYTLFRVTGNFNKAQICNGLWRVLLPLCMLVLMGNEYIILLAFALSLSVTVIVSLLLYYSSPINVEVVKFDEVSYLKDFTSFFVSLMIIIFFSFFDRFIAKGYIGEIAFSNYIYLLTILAFPFTLVASYLGFKEASIVKFSFNFKIYLSKIFFTFCVTFIIFSLWFAIVSIFEFIFKLEVNLESYIFLALLVTSKCCYSLVSAACTIHCSSNKLLFTNLINVLIFIVVFFAVYIGEPLTWDVEFLLMLSALAFCVRFFSFFVLMLSLRGLNVGE